MLGILGVLIFGIEQGEGRESDVLPAPTDRHCGINPEVSEEAQESFRLGLEAARSLTPDGFRRAAEHFDRATEHAPHFSLAYTTLADALINLSYFPGADRAELSRRARTAVQEALALDPTLPSSHLIRGIVRLFLDWDLDGAEGDFWRAIQLDPGYAQAHERYALVLVAKGQYAAAEVRLRHAVELAPKNLSYVMNLADLLILTDRPDQALEILGVEGWEPPLIHHGWLTRSHALTALGRDLEACDAELEYLKRALPNLQLQPFRDACDDGGPAALHALWLDALGDSTNLLLRAAFSAELGRTEAALAFLWQMHRERDPLLIWNARNPRFGALEEHPEYQRLLESIRPFDPGDPASIPATSHPSWAVRAPLPLSTEG
ncbi:MAG: tetratricopeptide repeat protein [Acidobacteriota bacterium]